MAAVRAGRVGWDIGSTAEIPPGEYAQMILQTFAKGEPHYVDLLEELCEDDEETDTRSVFDLAAVIRH